VAASIEGESFGSVQPKKIARTIKGHDPARVCSPYRREPYLTLATNVRFGSLCGSRLARFAREPTCSYEYSRVVVKGRMRKIALAFVVAVLPTWAAAQQTNQPPKYPKKAPRPHSTIGNPCAQYGVGFARVAGSDICIKIGGSVGVEAGGSSRR
jgi:hypothetical protein